MEEEDLMAIETERKFLVDREKWEAWKAEHKTVDGIRYIEQGYLSMDPDLSIRVRLETIPTGRKDKPDIQSGCLDIKGKLEGASRKEVSLETGDTLRGGAIVAKELLEMCGIFKLKKKRYWYRYEKLIWEVDEFENGLIMAEIELTMHRNQKHVPEDGNISLPPFVTKEVTHDPAYYNVNLVRSCSSSAEARRKIQPQPQQPPE